MFWTRALVLVVAVLALVLWIFAKTSLVDLLLFYYNGITQLLPGVIFALTWKRVSAWYSLHLSSGPWGINPGFIALVANVAVCSAVALLFPRRAVAVSAITPERA
jgi:Na+/proline symporter